MQNDKKYSTGSTLVRAAATGADNLFAMAIVEASYRPACEPRGVDVAESTRDPSPPSQERPA